MSAEDTALHYIQDPQMDTKTGPLQTRPPTQGGKPGTLEAGYPRPLYFICREDGSFVPLIAADELPHGLQLRGVPRRILDASSTVGMLNLGVISSSSRCYSLDNFSSGRQICRIPLKQDSSDPPRPPDAVITQQKGVGVASSRSQTENKAVDAASNNTQHFVKTMTIPLNKDVTNGWRPPQVNGEVRKEKEYCTYWLFHGECAFIHSAKGCRFKHEMPQDPKIMAEVGLKGPPKWWLDKTRATHRNTDWRGHGSNTRRSDGKANKPNFVQSPSRGSTRNFRATESGSLESRLAWLFTPSESPVNEKVNSTPLHEGTSSESGGLNPSTTIPMDSPDSQAKMSGESFQTAPTSPADTRSPRGDRRPLQLPRHNSYGDSSDEDLVSFN